MSAMKRRMNPQRHDGRDYLTTAQTAARLGLKTETVYAYVSRGLLTSTRIPAVRGSLFAVDEVEQLASRGGRTPSRRRFRRAHSDTAHAARSR